ncbi:TspO/MBR family protein [Dokdonella sp.]|uniref:TspO/MBR family protein n=1 Tax=Dokdonella sp. TaxID=2291710 RepID=UPI002F404B03
MAVQSHRRWAALAGWCALCFAAGGIGAVASVDARGFYADLVRPEWAPPPSVFGPVWSVLYLLMAIAAWRIGLSNATGARPALVAFVLQLAVNALWSWLFFAWHLGAASVLDIGLLWLLVVATLVLFWRIDRIAGALLVPYLAWVSFAGALCWAIWRANPTLLG